jgi:hypothetical protein
MNWFFDFGEDILWVVCVFDCVKVVVIGSGGGNRGWF